MTNSAPQFTEDQTLETPSGKSRKTENFPVGSFLIAPRLRPHIHALYNFARAADDIADNPLLYPSDKIGRLTHLEHVLLGTADDNETARAMRHSLKETNISPQHCLDLLQAFKQDAIKYRYRSWNELLDYCHYSASPVGRHVLALHGINEAAWPANDALCTALQIINHIQDCADDYRALDRVYIPQDDLDMHRADVAMLGNPKSTPELRRVLDRMLNAMMPMLMSARQLPRHVTDVRLKLETAIIAAIADDLVELLRKRDPLSQKTKLGKIQLLKAIMKGIGWAFS